MAHSPTIVDSLLQLGIHLALNGLVVLLAPRAERSRKLILLPVDEHLFHFALLLAVNARVL